MLGKTSIVGRMPLSGMQGFARSRGVRALQVCCSSKPKKNTLYNTEIHERAISILRNTQEFDFNWKIWTQRLGGTLVVSDEEHRGIVQQAAKDKNLSFGFSAGGLLFPFYVGVSAALQDAGLLTEETKLGGASAGSLIAACVKAGMPLDEITEHCMRLMHDCRVNGTRGRLGVSLFVIWLTYGSLHTLPLSYSFSYKLLIIT